MALPVPVVEGSAEADADVLARVLLASGRMDLLRGMMVLPSSSRTSVGWYGKFLLQVMRSAVPMDVAARAEFDEAQRKTEKATGLMIERILLRLKLVYEACQLRYVSAVVASAHSRGVGVVSHVQFDGTPMVLTTNGAYTRADCGGISQRFFFPGEDSRRLATNIAEDCGQEMQRYWLGGDVVCMTEGRTDLMVFQEILRRTRLIRDLHGAKRSEGFTFHHYAGDGASKGALRKYVGLRHERGVFDSGPQTPSEALLDLYGVDVCLSHGLHGAMEDATSTLPTLQGEGEQDDVKQIACAFRKSRVGMEEMASEWVAANYIQHPLDNVENYKATIDFLLCGADDDLAATLSRLQLRWEDGSLCGAVAFSLDDGVLGEIVAVVAGLAYQDFQFGRMGNALQPARRAALADVLGLPILAAHLYENGRRKFDIKQAFGTTSVKVADDGFAVAVWSLVSVFPPFEEAEAALLENGSILAAVSVRAALAQRVEKWRRQDFAMLWSFSSVSPSRVAEEVPRLQLAIDVCLTSAEVLAFRRLDMPPWVHFTAQDEITVASVLDSVQSTAVEEADEGFTRKLQRIQQTAPELLQIHAQSLQDVLSSMLALPQSIIIQEQYHKFAHRYTGGAKSFRLVNDIQWRAKFLEQNHMLRKTAGKKSTGASGPLPLAVVRAKSSACRVNASSMYTREKLAGNRLGFERQQVALADVAKSARLALSQGQGAAYAAQVRKRRQEIEEQAVCKYLKNLDTQRRLQRKEAKLRQFVTGSNTDNLDRNIPEKMFREEWKKLPANPVKASQKKRAQHYSSSLAKYHEQATLVFPYRFPHLAHGESLDGRVTTLLRQSVDRGGVIGGLLFLRRARPLVVGDLDVCVMLLTFVSERPYILGAHLLHIDEQTPSVLDGSPRASFSRTGVVLNLLSLEGQAYFLDSAEVCHGSCGSLYIKSDATWSDLEAPPFQRVMPGQPLRRGKQNANAQALGCARSNSSRALNNYKRRDLGDPNTIKDMLAAQERQEEELGRVRSELASERKVLQEQAAASGEDWTRDQVFEVKLLGGAWLWLKKQATHDAYSFRVKPLCVRQAAEAIGLPASRKMDFLQLWEDQKRTLCCCGGSIVSSSSMGRSRLEQLTCSPSIARLCVRC
ncbi:unnamed protein product [Amoebophrya sp. A25]|nr:unnamed protein product [Amoebophrya sp. A25]|eukprot:GSA25T00023423001.1